MKKIQEMPISHCGTRNIESAACDLPPMGSYERSCRDRCDIFASFSRASTVHRVLQIFWGLWVSWGREIRVRGGRKYGRCYAHGLNYALSAECPPRTPESPQFASFSLSVERPCNSLWWPTLASRALPRTVGKNHTLGGLSRKLG